MSTARYVTSGKLRSADASNAATEKTKEELLGWTSARRALSITARLPVHVKSNDVCHHVIMLAAPRQPNLFGSVPDAFAGAC